MSSPVLIDMEDIRIAELTVINPAVENYRLDVYISKRLHNYSRSLIQRLIKDKMVSVNGKPKKPSYEISVGDKIEVKLPRLIKPSMIAEDIPLNIIYEDNTIVLINKPPEFVVHPSSGHWSGTLANALLHHCGVLPQTDDIFRPGIVHRLDKNTSGIIITSKTEGTHAALAKQFATRTIKKQYIAIVEKEVRFDSDIIDAPIGRNPVDREKMKVNGKNAKEAITLYEVMERFKGYTVLKVSPKTGRTHQIRVHLEYIGHPIIADSTYNTRDSLYLWELSGKEPPKDLENITPIINRQALHAFSLKFNHPKTGEEMFFSAELPDDMSNLINYLRKYRSLGD